ncbi:hypothetical protein [Salicibibacter cibi]
MPDFLDKVWDVRKSPEQSQQMGLYPMDREFLEFIERAFDVYEQEHDK